MSLKFLYTLILVFGLSAWASSKESARRCGKITSCVQPEPVRGHVQPVREVPADKHLMSEKEGDEEEVPEYAPFLRALYV